MKYVFHRVEYHSATNIVMSQCVVHGTKFWDTHSKIPPGSRIYESKAIALTKSDFQTKEVSCKNKKMLPFEAHAILLLF